MIKRINNACEYQQVLERMSGIKSQILELKTELDHLSAMETEWLDCDQTGTVSEDVADVADGARFKEWKPNNSTKEKEDE